MKLPFFGKKSRTPDEFWSWFAANCHAFKDMGGHGKDQKALGDALSSVHEGLVWGMAPGKEGKPHTLEISADGVRDNIRHVLRLVRAAPLIPGWTIVAFRQPMPGFRIEMAGNLVDPETIRAVHTPAGPGVVHVQLFLPIPAEAPREVYAQIGFISLDHTLGEFRVMTQVGNVDFAHVTSAPPGAPSLAELLPHIQSIEPELPAAARPA